MCWGAFASIQEVLNWADTDTERQYLAVCLPPQSQRRQLVLIFVRYVDEHPAEGHRDFFFIAWTALREAFPCWH